MEIAGVVAGRNGLNKQAGLGDALAPVGRAGETNEC